MRSRHAVRERSRRRETLDLRPGGGDVGGRHPGPAILGHHHERVVAELVHEPRHAVGDAEHGVVNARLEGRIPIEAGRLHLGAHIRDRLSVVERLEVVAGPDPLREALHLRAAQDLLELRRAPEHDVHGRHRRGDVRELPQLFEQPSGERVAFVDEDHEPRAGRGQAADALHDADPQLGFVDAAVGLADLGENRLPQRPPRADAGPREQRHVEVFTHAVGHLRQQERLARARRADHEADSLGAAHEPVEPMERRVDALRRMVEVDSRGGEERTARRVAARGDHRGGRLPGVSRPDPRSSARQVWCRPTAVASCTIYRPRRLFG